MSVQGNWRRERNWDPTVFANRVVIRKPLQALSFGDTAGRIHSSLRGRREAAARWGQNRELDASISKTACLSPIWRQLQTVGRCHQTLRPAGRIGRNGK